MKLLFGWLVASCVLLLGGSYAWMHRQDVAKVAAPAAPAVTQGTPTDANYEEVQDAQRVVTITGPLADYMSHQKPDQVETVQPSQPIPHKASASDHVGASPVGTSSAILHQTFGVASIVSFPFEVPAHASTPQLRGTYRSFVKQGRTQSSDAAADVEFLLLNEQQYGEFLSGRAGEAVFSAEDAHNQEVNTGLPPTFDQSAKYYLVFRNTSHDAGKKLVQAEFRIDF